MGASLITVKLKYLYLLGEAIQEVFLHYNYQDSDMAIVISYLKEATIH